MKLVVETSIAAAEPETKSFILANKNVDVVLLNLPINLFINADQSFNLSFFNQLRDNIKANKAAGKKTAIQIPFGKFLSLIKGVRYLLFTESHHQGKDKDTPAVPMRIPVFYEKVYLDYVKRFFSWFAENLIKSKIYDLIEYIKVTGVNQATFEMRCPDQDITGTGEPYYNAALKWRMAGYTNQLALISIADLVNHFILCFPKKLICFPFIPGKAAFPCLSDQDEICYPKQREFISKRILDLCLPAYELFSPQSTYYDVGVHDIVTESSSPFIIQQINNQMYGQQNSPSPEKVIEYGKSKNLYALEVFENTIRNFPELH